MFHYFTISNLYLKCISSSALETKKYGAEVFLDVTKAFGTSWHGGLLFKLKSIFPTHSYLILKSYLENRSFNVRHNLQHSINILFLLVSLEVMISLHSYIPFTRQTCPHLKIHTIFGTYADDTGLLSASLKYTIASQQLETHLNTVLQWFTNWKIKINESKSSFVTS